ncbi:dethiobiotin synthase [Vibrio caribbeanicus]|uniref:ATP-dependent dethiobiotin synthetase BioD n=1 Tax=Vibrio caribbeanicus ATCC BAA-2122 TaxID=796620 RepID=E3BEG3_9VIBR|nr:dethiobiotin synthase [Vibrio caribbeanicus]EFP98580.1 dithiobiotin synthetase [Vibrio caribbeanicus ATCC BAA-2122]
MAKKFFIAGTDTDVGKTVASIALLTWLNSRGYRTVGYKPVAAGCEMKSGSLRNSDANYLQKFSSVKLAYENINPYPLKLAASPHIAAKSDNVNISFDLINQKLAENERNTDMVLIEGAGGWRVPISETIYLSDWVKLEKIPVILVVGIKLGCLNHAVLSADAIRSDGVDIVGWVANQLKPDTEHYAEMVTMLSEKLEAPLLGEIPFLNGSVMTEELRSYIDLTSIL